MTSRTRPRSIIAVGLAAVLLLAGCSFFPDGGGTTGGGTGGNGGSGTSDGQTGQTGDTGDAPVDDPTGLTTGGIPDGFPISEVPLIDGEVAIGIDLGTGWTVILKVVDPQASMAEASQKLKAAGFEAIAETNSTEASLGVFRSEKYQVQVTATDAPEYGPSVSYVVILRG